MYNRFLLSILIVICFVGCNKDDEELPTLIHSDNCKMESWEIFKNQVLDHILKIEYDADFNLVRRVQGSHIMDNPTYFIENHIYNDDNLIKSIIFSNGANEATATATGEDIYHYNGKKLLEYVEFHDYSTDLKWKRLLYEYHSNGNLKKQSAFNPDSDGTPRSWSEYKENGKLVLSVGETGKSYFEYDSRDSLIKYEFWRDEKLSSQYLYTYNNQGQILKEDLKWYYDDYYSSLKTENTYNSKNKLILSTVEAYDGLYHNHYSRRSVYEYDLQDLLIKSSGFYNEVFNEYSLFEYDSKGKEIRRSNYSVNNGNPVLKSENIKTYSASGKILSHSYLILQGEKIFTQYDHNGNKVFTSKTDNEGVEYYREEFKFLCR